MASEIGIAFQKVGASADSLSVPFSKVSAIIATISSVTREAPETIGSAVKSIFSRIESVKQKGYDSEDGTTINAVSKALAAANIQLTDAKGNFRDFNTVLDELGTQWKNIDDKTQRYIATTVAGVYQSSRFLALMNNYPKVIDLNNQALNSAGTTQQKYNLYLEGTQAHIDRLKAKLETLWGNTFNSGGINALVDTLGSLVSGVGSIVKEFGFLPPVLFAATTALIIFNSTAKSFAKDVIPSMLGGAGNLSKYIKNVIIDIQGLGVATNVTTGALPKLVSGLKSLAFATGIGVAIAGVAWAISALVQSHQKLAAQQAQLIADNKTVATSWENQKDKIVDLVAQFNKLREATNDGKNFANTEQEQKYLDITNQLKTLMPSLVSSINSKGEAHLKSADAIARELVNAEKLAKIEQETAVKNAKSDFGSDVSDRSGLVKNKDFYQKQIDTGRAGGNANSLRLLSDKEIDDAKAKVQDYQNQIDDSYDKTKERISTITTSIVQLSGIKLGDNVSTELTKIVSKLDVSKLSKDDLATKVTRISETLQYINAHKGSDGLLTASSNAEAYSIAVGRLSYNLSISKDQAMKFLDVINGAKIAPVTQGTKDFAEAIVDLDKNITAIDKELGSLGSAYETLHKGEALSAETILTLLSQYPELAKYLNTTNDLTFQKGQIIKDVAEIQRKQLLQEAQNEYDSNQTLIDSLNAKRLAYETFYAQLGFKFNSVYSDMDRVQLDEASKANEALQARLTVLKQPIENFFKSGKSSGSPPPPNTAQSETKRDMDEFARANRDLDGQIVVSDAHLNKLNTTTQAYRNELEKQIPIYKAKQALASQEADSIRADDAVIQHRLDTEKLTISQRNTLLNQLDSNMTKVSGLSKSWADYDKTLSDIANKNSLSLVNEAIDKSTNSTKGFTDKITSLKTAMDSLKTDPAAKIADQVELIKTYGDEQTALIETNKQLLALSSTLDQNSDAYSKNKDEINKNKASLTQISADIESERMKIATQVVDTMKKGIQTEIDAEKNLHDIKIKNIDDATNAAIAAIDKIQQANDYNKNLEKDQTAAQLLQNQINAYSLDNSNEGKSKVIELKKQLADAKDKIDDEQTKRSNDLVKQSLQDQNKATKDSLDDQSKLKTDALQNQLNDDTHWLSVERDLINGHVEGIKTDMNNLIDGLGTYAQQSLAIVGSQVSKIKSMIDQITSSKSQVGNLGSLPTGNIGSSGATGTGETGGATTTWQQNLERAKTDNAYAASEIKRAQDVYNADKAAGNMTGANSAHDWADRIRAVNPSVASLDTGGMTGNFSGGKLAFLHGKELVLNSIDTSNILKVVDFTRDIMSKIKTPDFSSIMNKNNAVTAGNTAHLTMYNTFTGGQQGQDAIGVMVNGLKRIGVQII